MFERHPCTILHIYCSQFHLQTFNVIQKVSTQDAVQLRSSYIEANIKLAIDGQ